MIGTSLVVGWRRRLLAALACGAVVAGASLPGLSGSVAASEPAGSQAPVSDAPIVLLRQGAFAAGGTVLRKGDATLSCDHGYVEYQIPQNPRSVSLFMWHSSSAAVWQNRWDGGEGYQSIFLRRGFPVYLWDGPRVGRANWGCEEYDYKPWVGRDQGNFIAWRFGARAGEWFDGVQFPKDDPKALEQAMRARYAEFDVVRNAQLETDAAAVAVDRIGPTVLVTNSAGGFRALLTAMKSGNVKGIVAYENPGYVFPKGQGPQLKEGVFGPVYVSDEEFDRLTRIPIQFVWGDNIDKSESWTQFRDLCKQFVALVNARGGHAEILNLPDAGLHGNTHIPFADLNNHAVADLLSAFLARNKLDPAGAGEGKAGR